MAITDKLHRPLRDLRISVTDRCNFRCVYCMPKEVFGPDFAFLPQSELLTFEEITRLVKIFSSYGVRKVRLTGGEPLLRRDLEKLISQLADIPGIEDIAMTTNGSLLTAERSKSLRAAGLKRVSVSLDSLNDDTFRRMNDVNFPVEKVLAAIDGAKQAGLEPVKVNMVVKRGYNDEDILPMAEYFREHGQVLRFIEYMDVGNTNGWKLDDVVSTGEILDRIGGKWPVEAVPPQQPGEVATRYRYKDGRGEIGFVSSVTRPFCGNCNRLRLSAKGSLYTCLFASTGTDFRALLRGGQSDEQIAEGLSALWGQRTDRYSEVRSENTQKQKKKIEMSQIGG